MARSRRSTDSQGRTDRLRRAHIIKEASAETDAAEKCAQPRLLEIDPGAFSRAQIDVQQAAMKSVHGSASRVRGKNKNLVARTNFGVRRSDKSQTVYIARVAAHQTVGVDDAPDKDRKLGRES